MSQQFTGDHVETGRKTTQDRENALRQVITNYQGYVNAADIRFRALFIMASQPDGTWRITRQMWNNKPN